MKENKGIVTKCRGSSIEESSRHFRSRFLSWMEQAGHGLSGSRCSLCGRGARVSLAETQTGRGRAGVETVFGEDMLGASSPREPPLFGNFCSVTWFSITVVRRDETAVCIY